MTTKRAYKLQFVAHSSSVNCLKIGRKSSRVLVTGGEDHKVNLWAIGKPNAILSLSGHTSAVESVSFDTSEVLVAAGAASGTIKLWDLEEAKIVRTLTGHRSNCISVDFHPFGEFFASGSLDTNLKIWDIRRKGCIHTYKGHTRGVNAIRFTPDGRWVVSGGEDNIVKLWDLTAGKLLHDFKCHEGQIQCIDFHPHEFLLATGSADRTVKFWDLETFELIGSAGPETTGVRSMTFNPNGRTLLCGLHESLKVFSWEPIRCHDAVDVGWSRLSDMNIHEGKLLGCSYNQSCVGVWVVDISRIEPYAIASAAQSNGHPELKSTSSGNLSVLTDNSAKISTGRISVSQNSDPVVKETKTLGRLSVSQNSDSMKEAKPLSSTGSIPVTLQRVSVSSGPKTTMSSAVVAPSAATLKRGVAKSHSTANHTVFNKSDVLPIIVPRNNVRLEQASDSRKEITAAGRTSPFSMQARVSDFQKLSNIRDDQEKSNVPVHSGSMGYRTTELNEVTDQNFLPTVESLNPEISTQERNVMDAGCPGPGKHGVSSSEPSAGYQHENYHARVHKVNRDAYSVDIQKGGRTHVLVPNWKKRESSPGHEGPPTSSNSSETTSAVNMLSFNTKGRLPSAEKETVSASNEGAVSDLMEHHDQFVGSMQSRLTKLQVIRRYWERNDVKGAISAMEKMGDHAVLADVISIFTEKIDIVTLDICTCLLPLLTVLLGSNMDRHLGISLETLLKLVRIYGSVIRSTLSASSSVGVDIQAEQRLERCNLCFIELEKVKRCLPSLVRRGGLVAKSAQELNLALQEVL
ncbi:katanin p80 WD40 repeat-containing subunit B1 homolog KTN80.4-like isoform X2 [Macadamia integrifolia]|uniref:katanin p80 WD40 repeat-containing subunit B1 homolog KTN80.4-like isoform X2 n=1 Tax=Macadamia integrifolia TaxID=60698 RepID=UPI001C4F58D8|nr:katanin p80 WD40 repeat-containing subunit B1 homolog KTN80.4-like isoform X2 [Macadamia integrifolia]XP_042507278.1 katanin p80 WD40 repeat-containing subunit B1 homolog KTN80.4-like isoform X2 [Macadamia integrifolia]